MIKTLSDAVTLVEFIVSKQGKSVEEAMQEAEVPLHLRDHVLKYFSPPLQITPPDLITDTIQRIPRCNPDIDSMQQYFGTFQRFLIDTRRWPKSTVGTLAETSLDLIKQLPKPDAAESFKAYGLVLGYIQSGKTANMAALIARAADEGYKLFIVLAGLWKDLRAQTQRRFDQEITGRSDDPADEPCVQHDSNMAPWARLTQSGLNGDFSDMPNNLDARSPHLAVIKKNKRIESLMEWLERCPVPLKDLPAIIIDDEADQGSINTNYGRTDDDGESIDPSATNRRIRELIQKLPKCVYIGFTATPFANVLIDAEEDDLYPRDFIATLPEPPGYFGPRKLFGLGMDPSDLSPHDKHGSPLDVIHKVEDTQMDEIDDVLENGGDDCPEVLSEALIAFLLSSCARLARGHDQAHFSMLIHPSQRTAPHRIVATVISKELELLKAAAIRPAKFPDLLARARKMWEFDFARVTSEQEDTELADYNFDFEKVWKFAKSITESIEVKVLNNYSEDTLDYTGHPKRYIVIGGNRLSRGLTLEGLSVSVFTRMANQYDTLLQMGRWFGYRPKYYDLTRIYVGKEMGDRFAELARVEDELRADLRKYAQKPDPPTPLQLKPIIRTHPTMAVTSRLKMGAGRPVTISFQNTIQQTVSFPVDNKALLRKNLDAARGFVSKLGNAWHSGSDEGIHIWKDLPCTGVIEFLNAYEFSREAHDVNRQNLVNYIKRQNDQNELILWDIVLPLGNPKLEPFSWSTKYLTHKIVRTPMTIQSIKVLSSPSDIEYWREKTGRDSKDPLQGCLILYMIDKESGSEKDMKFFHDPNNAEDILGLVIIFPESKSDATIEYISQ
ncbi:MAG: Z1 domain-containing protein [Candidatus Peregrinibacteria bacterium Greene0416_19]|nr:MAG: Z1 domain-containing protein [Candidatus Peregrinibacteria bacterium Greene0416_19]